MTQAWTCRLRISPQSAKLLVIAPDWGDLLKAQLPTSPEHPRALLTLLEGLSLWHGKPLSVALRAEDGLWDPRCSALLGDGWWPGESPLVEFRVEGRVRRGRLAGIGDFSALRRGLRDR